MLLATKAVADAFEEVDLELKIRRTKPLLVGLLVRSMLPPIATHRYQLLYAEIFCIDMHIYRNDWKSINIL